MALERSADEDLTCVRSRLLQTARRSGIPEMDVDDVVDRALAKATRPDRRHTEGVALGPRAGQALKDEQADYWRRRATRPQIIDTEPPDLPDSSDPTAAIDFREACIEIEREFGREVIEFVFLRIYGLSEREIGERAGWTPLRAARVRRRLQRNASTIYAILRIPVRSEQKEAS